MKKMLSFLLAAVLLLGLCAVAFADAASPQKEDPLPEVDPSSIVIDGDGDPAYKVRDDDVVIQYYIKTKYVTFTSAAAAAKSEESGMANLVQASKDLASCSDLNEVLPLDEALKAADSEVKAEDMLVRYLFHIHLADEIKENLKSVEGVVINFKIGGVKLGDTVCAFLCSDETGEWSAFDACDVTVLEDGLVEVRFKEFGTIAFLTNA